jgi:hypothetical protein
MGTLWLDMDSSDCDGQKQPPAVGLISVHRSRHDLECRICGFAIQESLIHEREAHIVASECHKSEQKGAFKANTAKHVDTQHSKHRSKYALTHTK